MKLAKNFIMSIVIVAFPIFIAVNAYFFLIQLDPSFNFLGVKMGNHYAFIQQQLDRCPYGGVSYFGFSSFLDMVEDLPQDDVFKILRGFFNSFKVANFYPLDTMPNIVVSDNPTIIEYLKVIYYVLSILLMPLVALGWLGYSVGFLAIDIVNVIDVLLNAMAGLYNNIQCHTYPLTLAVQQLFMMFSI